MPCIYCQRSLDLTRFRIGESYRWDLLGQVDGLDDGESALLDGALQVHVLDLIAEVGLRADQADIAILDFEVDVCAVFDRLMYDALGFDEESRATARHIMISSRCLPCLV